jgi:hypothetical protein
MDNPNWPTSLTGFLSRITFALVSSPLASFNIERLKFNSHDGLLYYKKL